MTYLLDTNVLSEPLKPKPDSRVVGWLNATNQDQLYISVLTLGEIRKGVEQKTAGTRKTQLTKWLETELPGWFEERIVSVDAAAAEIWGIITAKSARPLPAIDGLIAASCLAHNLTLVTRNVKDFAGIAGLRVHNPWEG